MTEETTDPTIATTLPGEPMPHANPRSVFNEPIIVPSNFPLPPHPLTEADLQAARAEVPPGSATLSGTMTTVTPAAALVGLFAIWYASKYGHPLPDAGIIYATILVTTLAHGIKVLLTKLYPSVFSNAPAESFGYHDYHGHNP